MIGGGSYYLYSARYSAGDLAFLLEVDEMTKMQLFWTKTKEIQIRILDKLVPNDPVFVFHFLIRHHHYPNR